jgi:hypothetical protein
LSRKSKNEGEESLLQSIFFCYKGRERRRLCMVFSPPIQDGDSIEVGQDELIEALTDYDFDPLEEVLEEIREDFEVDAGQLDEYVEALREEPEILDAVSHYIADDFIEEEDLDYDYYLRRFTDDLIVYLFQQWRPEEE